MIYIYTLQINKFKLRDPEIYHMARPEEEKIMSNYKIKIKLKINCRL